MLVQDINLTQVVIVLLFLGTLIFLQQMLKNNKFNFQTRFNQNRRIQIVDDFILSNTERARLIKVDNKEYLYFTQKGCQPTVVEHEPTRMVKSKQNIQLKKVSGEKNSNQQRKDLSIEKNNVLSDAITAARRMNPKLGFKK